MNDDYYQGTNPANGAQPADDQPQAANPADSSADANGANPTTDFSPPAPPAISQDTPEAVDGRNVNLNNPEPIHEDAPMSAPPAEEPKPADEMPKPVAEPVAAEPMVDEPKPEEPAIPGMQETPSTAPDEPKTEKSEQTPPEAAREAKTPAEAYDVFVEQLLKNLGFEELQEPQKGKLVDAIKMRVEARVLRVLVTSLTKEQADEFDREIEEKDLSPEAIIKLLSEKAPNASSAILSALDDLYMEMKEETELLWKVAASQSVAEAEDKTSNQQ